MGTMSPVIPMLTLVGVVHAATPRTLASEAIRDGRPRRALQLSTARLQRAPDDPEAMATLAGAWSRTGHFADAAATFDLALGSSWYEDLGIESHADALRAGASPEAARLHEERLAMGGLSTGREIRLHVDLVDDHRAAGDLISAQAAADAGLALTPRAPTLLAAEADILVDLGHLEAAEAALAQSLDAGPTLRAHLVAARIALLRDQPFLAFEWAEEGRRFRSQSLRLSAVRLEAMRRLDDQDGIDDVLGMLRVRYNDHPEIMAVKMRIHADRGERAALLELSERARQLYPDNTELQTTRRLLGLDG